MTDNRVVRNTRRYQIVVAKDGDGVVRKKKILHKSNKVRWVREVEDGTY